MNSQGSTTYTGSSFPATSESVNFDDDLISDSSSETVKRLITKSLKRARAKKEQIGLDDILKAWSHRPKMHKMKMSLLEEKLKLQEEKMKIFTALSDSYIKIENAKIDLEKRKLDLEEKKFRHQQRQDELNFMLMDTSSLDEAEKQNIDLLRAQILARQLQK